MRPSLSAIVPCYNEALALPLLYARLSAVLESCFGYDYEVVLVNDGSSDSTWIDIVDLAKLSSRVIGVDLSRNHGHQLAITAGLSVSRGDLVVVLDADLQDPPELLPLMLAKLRESGADVVYGRRTKRTGETLFKRTSAALFYRLLSHVSSTSIPPDVGDFRLMTRRVVDLVNSMSEHQRFLRGMVSWVGFRQVAFDYERPSRAAGTTHYPLRKMVRLALDALTSFSLAPLRASIYLGIILTLSATAISSWVLWTFAVQGHVKGWQLVLAVVLVLAAIQMLVIGLLGEYIGRIHEQTQARPLFIIREVFRAEVIAE